jgi:hypothetical protein
MHRPARACGRLTCLGARHIQAPRSLTNVRSGHCHHHLWFVPVSEPEFPILSAIKQSLAPGQQHKSSTSSPGRARTRPGVSTGQRVEVISPLSEAHRICPATGSVPDLFPFLVNDRLDTVFLAGHFGGEVSSAACLDYGLTWLRVEGQDGHARGHVHPVHVPAHKQLGGPERVYCR